MARNLDNFPVYDPVVDRDSRDSEYYLSAVWQSFMATFIDSLSEYLTAFGVFTPVLTLAQRNSIQAPVEGQLIYVSDANSPTLPRTASLQVWQVVAGVGQWTTIV